LTKNADKSEAGIFQWKFFNIFKKDTKALKIIEKVILEQGIQKLDTFYIDPKSTQFYYLIQEIADLCEFLTFDPEDKDGITQDEFRDSIEKIFSK